MPMVNEKGMVPRSFKIHQPCIQMKTDRNAEILRLSGEGKTQREIADVVGVSVGSINASVQKGNRSESEQESRHLQASKNRPQESANDDLAEADPAQLERDSKGQIAASGARQLVLT